MFTPTIKYQKLANQFLLNTTSRLNVTFVGVHIRQGDYATEFHFQRGRRFPNLTYMTNAMDYYRHKFHSVHFVVCSDSPHWSAEHLTGIPNVTISYGHSWELDFTILIRCNHSIVTVGTFGWWAAYLTQGEAVYFDKPWAGKLLRRNNMMKKDYFLPDWMSMAN